MNSAIEFNYQTVVKNTESELTILANRFGSSEKVFIKCLSGQSSSLRRLSLNDQLVVFSELKSIGVMPPSAKAVLIDQHHLLIDAPGFLPLKPFILQNKDNLTLLIRLSISLIKLFTALHKGKINNAIFSLDDLLVDGEDLYIFPIGFSKYQSSKSKIGSSDKNLETSQKILSRTIIANLGSLLYEVFTGVKISNSSDSKRPKLTKSLSASEINPSLPQVLSQIISRAIPGDGAIYHTPWGIMKDLQLALSQLESYDTIGDFPLGKWDVVDIPIPVTGHVSGRTLELKILEQMLNNAKDGTFSSVYIEGPPGTGKTFLMNYFADSLPESFFFASSKFNESDRNIPYAGISSAFEPYFNHLLSNNPQQVHLLQKHIEETISPHEPILLTIFPTLSQLLKNVKRSSLEITLDSEHLVSSVFLKFLKGLIELNKPLVLFLDDIHWADAASARLLRKISESRTLPSCLLACTSRPCAGEPHAEQNRYRKYLSLDSFDHFLSINNLSIEEIKNLIAYRFQCPLPRASSLAKVIELRTNGNPLFISSFIDQLLHDEIIYFDYDFCQW